MQPINKAIREARLSKGLSQVQAAKKIGMSKSYICELESGKCYPGPDLFQKICKFYGIDPDTIYIPPEKLARWNKWK